MNNKTNIKEDIENVKFLLRDLKSDNYSYNQAFINSLENILADRERLEKENEEMQVEIAEQVYFESMPIEEIKRLQEKANKYDSLLEKIKKDIEEYPEATYTKYYLLDCLGLLKG